MRFLLFATVLLLASAAFCAAAPNIAADDEGKFVICQFIN